MEIKRFRDEVKLLEGDLQAIIEAHVETETGRQVSSVELHNGRMGIGAATVQLKFADEVEAKPAKKLEIPEQMRELLHGVRESLEYVDQRPAPVDAVGNLSGYAVRASYVNAINKLLRDRDVI